jgi:hypothetical protein
MDLPSSGWYPDPYGTPLLLRWWDGSGWTQHTHPDVTAGAGGGEPAATALQSAVQSTAVQATTVQATALQATTVQAGTGQATTVRAVPGPGTGQPSAERLSRTKPPTGRPTAPQPALPAFPGAATAVAATAYQPPVTAGQPDQMQPTAVQPGYPQPGAVPPGTVPPGAGQPGGDGTQVLFLGGDAWQPSGGPGGYPPGNPYGYQEAQRRRRRRVVIGLSAGTAVAVAAIVIIATTLGSSSSTQVADQAPAAAPTSAAALASSAPIASPSPTASPSPAATTTTGSQLTDSQAGLSYAQLATPWQGASCPPSLDNGAFPWTAGEYAVAGQVNGGQTTWYGEACSGLLPQQYGYSGVANLQSTAENLAQTFSNAYYGDLSHNVNTGQDGPVQVSGHAAWQVSYDVAYGNAAAQGATWTDEQATVIVVDNGTNQPAVFFTSIPNTLNEANVSTLGSSLQLTAAAGGGQATAAPADTSQDNGNGGNGNGDGSQLGSNP